MAKLINGGTVDDSELTYDQQASRVYWKGQDVSNQISQNEKIRLFPDYDQRQDAFRASDDARIRRNQKPLGGELDESTGSVLIDQIENDGVLAAPLETLDRTVSQVFSSTGIKTLIVAGVLVLAAVVYLRK